MNYILDNRRCVPWYTSLVDVFNWLEIKAEDYDWHFSDIVGGWDELNEPSWETGDELAKNLATYNYQFVWAVISAYPKGTEPFISEIPYAGGNQEFWSGVPQKQLRSSLFEIVCWDSSATLFIGLSEELSKKLLQNVPYIKDLNKENSKRNFL